MCFSLHWLEQLLVWLIVLAAVVALLKLVLPYVLNTLGSGGAIAMQAVNIVVWAIVAVAIVYFVFTLISCLMGVAAFR